MSAAQQVKLDLKIQVQIVKGPHVGEKFSLDKESIKIGRGFENDIVLSNDPKISRQHVEIKWQDQKWYVINLSQKNFFLFNGLKVDAEKIENEANIVLGDTEIKVNVNSPLDSDKTINIKQSPSNLAIREKGAFLTKEPPKKAVIASSAISGLPSQKIHAPPPISDSSSYVGHSGHAYSQEARTYGNQSSRLRFYVIIGVIAFLGYLLFSSPIAKKKTDPNAIRTSSQLEKEIQESENQSKLLKERLEKFENSANANIYKKAEENFIKGFRDYQVGNYLRARDAFQVVLNLNPEHQQAKRYYHLSKVKFDEQVKKIMITANGYRESNNWKRCQSSYSMVLVLLQHRQDDPTFHEAKKFYEECSLGLKGRY